MNTMRLRDGSDGKPRYVRLPYRAARYAVPAGYVERMSADDGGYSNRDLLAEYDGPFRGFNHGPRFQRDGHEWLTLFSPQDWAIEVELPERGPDRIVALPPWEAWRLARARDGADVEVRDAAPEENALSAQLDAIRGGKPPPQAPPPEFDVPPSFVDKLRADVDARGPLAVLADLKSPAAGLREVVRFERDGKRWIRLLSGFGWAVDLELGDGRDREIRAVSRDVAERMATTPTAPPDL